MRKQTKVLAAAALFTLGASFSAFAAKKGTWALENGEWYCYDSDGDAIENDWCLSNGLEYYVGDDGTLVCDAWVEDDGDYYFTNAGGAKVKNDWRFVTPYEDDDSDEEWFYFKSNGKMAKNEKLVIKGKTYFFDEDGIMLTGWVTGSKDNGYDESNDTSDLGNTYYCDEDGARVSKEWIYDYAPGVDEDDADEDDLNWYWIKGSGKPATSKQSSINGQTYFFGSNAVMLSGWVKSTGSNAEQIWVDEAEATDTVSDVVAAGYDVYYCGDENDGHVKKDGWFYAYPNTTYGLDDSDKDMFWFYAQSNGKVFVASGSTEAQEYDLDDVTAAQATDGDIANDGRFSKDGDAHAAVELKKLNGKYYLFNENGQMVYGFVEFNGHVYYFGGENDGARKDGSFTVTDDNGETAKCYFATETTSTGYYDCAGIDGAKNGKLYASGVLVKAQDAKYELKTVAGMQFIVNKSGSIQSDTGVYKEDGEELFGGKKFTYNTTTKGVSYHKITN